jgi:hypothetical protein
MGKNRLEAFSDGVLFIGVAFWNQWLAQAAYVLVALLWLVPDRRIEKALGQHQG